MMFILYVAVKRVVYQPGVIVYYGKEMVVVKLSIDLILHSELVIINLLVPYLMLV
jgi:hypothetical protein